MFLADPEAGQTTQDDDDDFAYDTKKIPRPLVCEESDDDYIPPTQGMLEQLPYLYSAHSLCTCVIC